MPFRFSWWLTKRELVGLRELDPGNYKGNGTSKES
jgi:hypothetical protein